MIREELINEFITNHVFPQFREVRHPIFDLDRYFAVGLNNNNRIACIPFYNKGELRIAPFTWSTIQNMFSLTEDEIIIALTRWFRDNFPLLCYHDIILVTYL